MQQCNVKEGMKSNVIVPEQARGDPQLSENVERRRSVFTAGQKKRSFTQIRSKSPPPPPSNIPLNAILLNAVQCNEFFFLFSLLLLEHDVFVYIISKVAANWRLLNIVLWVEKTCFSSTSIRFPAVNSSFGSAFHYNVYMISSFLFYLQLL